MRAPAHRCPPVGNKAAKNKAKANATTSQNSAPTASPTSAAAHAYGDLVRAANQRMLLDTHNALRQTDDPNEAQYLKKMIDALQRRLGML